MCAGLFQNFMVLLLYLSIFVLVLHCLDYSSLEMKQKFSSVVGFSPSCFSFSWSFVFKYKFQNRLVNLYQKKKKLTEISIGITLSLYINIGKIDIFIILNFLAHVMAYLSISLDLTLISLRMFVIFKICVRPSLTHILLNLTINILCHLILL